jgi:ribosome-binding factor A
MASSSKRVKRVSDLIHREVAMILRQNVVDPRLQQLVVTLVDASPDLKNATVFFTVPDVVVVAEAETALIKAAGFMRSQLAKSSGLRHAPRLSFKHDAALLKAERLSSLIDQVAPPVEQ